MSKGSRQIANSALVRKLNAGRVLDALRAEHAMSTNALVDHTGMSRPTVHAAAQHLLDLGWIAETADAPTTAARGRPSRVFAFRAAAGHVLGVDIGAHTVRTALADLRGEVVAERALTFEQPDLPAAERLARVRESALATVRDAGLGPGQVLAVCVGSSGTISPEGVVTLRTGIPGFLGTNLRTALEAELPWRITVENDCNLAAIAERWCGLATRAEDVVCLLAGERLGVGVFAGGALLRGHRNGARDLGFLSFMGDADPEEGIGSAARAQGRRLVAGLAERGGPAEVDGPWAPAAVLYDLVDGDPERIDAEDVFAAIRAGDGASARILEHALGSVTRAVAVLGMLLAPELVVISGAVAKSGDVLLDPLRRGLGELMPQVPTVRASPLEDRAVVTGAVRLALDSAESRFLDALAPAPG